MNESEARRLREQIARTQKAFADLMFRINNPPKAEQPPKWLEGALKDKK